MTYRVLKDYEPHEFKVGDIVGISAKNKKFIKQLTNDGIIEALSQEETQAAFDELRKGK